MLMRSKLFVPGSRPELFAKAASSEADAISFDLEDAVAHDRKEDARAAVLSFLRSNPLGSGKVAIVRVNAIGTPWFERDIAAAVAAGAGIVNLPKVESAADIHLALAAMARAADGPNQIGLLANIETPKGIRLAAEIAAADAPVIGLQLGLVDLFLPLSIARHEASAVQYARVAVRLAAGEAGIPAYDAAFTDIRNPAGCRQEAEGARALGFAGKSCIHPSQVAIANEVFAPREAELAHAPKVLEAAREEAARGSQAFVVDGQLIDAPMIAHAKNVIEAARRHEAAAAERTQSPNAG
jgi:citrate lyase subunit beta/citryl-CoA lyase